jgi:hypothetical protein
MEIIRGKQPGAKKTVIYGPEGIGKSTLASGFPDPLFIDTEGSTKDMDVARTEEPSSWAMLMEQVTYVKNHPDICRTLVIDTADWAEMLCVTHLCDKNHKNSIEEFGYGKGYTYLQEEFGRLLNLLTDVVKAGVNVVLTAHAKMRKFEQPDEMGAYDRWEMKLSKGVAPMVKEWADMVLFANYKTMVVNVDGQGAQKGKNKAQGGKRVMYTTHHSCWDAKNRYGLPDEVPFTYESIREIVEPGNRSSERKTEPVRSQMPPVQPTVLSEQTVPVSNKGDEKPAKEAKSMAPVESSQKPVKEEKKPTLDPRIPKKLRDLMIANDVCEWDIQNVCEAKGYVPLDTPLYLYEDVNPGFIDGVLVAAWDQVYAAIKGMKEKDALVFN